MSVRRRLKLHRLIYVVQFAVGMSACAPSPPPQAVSTNKPTLRNQPSAPASERRGAEAADSMSSAEAEAQSGADAAAPPAVSQNRNAGAQVPSRTCDHDMFGSITDGRFCEAQGPEQPVVVDARNAQRLEYFTTGRRGILAPTGGECSSYCWSGGFSLFVRPEPLQYAQTLGYGVSLKFYDGETSGWMAISRIAARVFPARRALVQEKIDKGWFPNGLAFGPYPKDQLVHTSPTIVHYVTPANEKGLGTEWGPFKPNERPIRGLIMLIESTHGPVRLVFVAARLPPELDDLTATIIEGVRNFQGWSKM